MFKGFLNQFFNIQEKFSYKEKRRAARRQRFKLRNYIFFNQYLTRVVFTNGQCFVHYSFLPRRRAYEEDFFRNVLWEILDEPPPIESILSFIRKYGYLPRKLLMRIYFYEAKKKRRYYEDVARSMDKYIARILGGTRKRKRYRVNPLHLAF